MAGAAGLHEQLDHGVQDHVQHRRDHRDSHRQELLLHGVLEVEAADLRRRVWEAVSPRSSPETSDSM